LLIASIAAEIMDRNVMNNNIGQPLIPIRGNEGIPIQLQPIEQFFDNIFHDIFMNEDVDESILLQDMTELTGCIRMYEETTDIKLFISKACIFNDYRVYKCRSHLQCNFKATFGRRRGRQGIFLRRSNLHHTGFVRNI
jgi:hypothetical protein